MVYNKKTQRKRSKSASKSRRRRSRGGDIEDGKPAPNVAELMKPPNRSISPTNAPLPTYDQAMKSRTPRFDVLDAAEKGEAGDNLVGGKRRKGKRSKKRRKGRRSKKTRRGKRSKKTRKGKRSTKKKSLFGKLFGL